MIVSGPYRVGMLMIRPRGTNQAINLCHSGVGGGRNENICNLIHYLLSIPVYNHLHLNIDIV